MNTQKILLLVSLSLSLSQIKIHKASKIHTKINQNKINHLIPNSQCIGTFSVPSCDIPNIYNIYNKITKKSIIKKQYEIAFLLEFLFLLPLSLSSLLLLFFIKEKLGSIGGIWLITFSFFHFPSSVCSRREM